jgi:hypothetical protein
MAKDADAARHKARTDPARTRVRFMGTPPFPPASSGDPSQSPGLLPNPCHLLSSPEIRATGGVHHDVARNAISICESFAQQASNTRYIDPTRQHTGGPRPGTARVHGVRGLARPGTPATIPGDAAREAGRIRDGNPGEAAAGRIRDENPGEAAAGRKNRGPYRPRHILFPGSAPNSQGAGAASGRRPSGTPADTHMVTAPRSRSGNPPTGRGPRSARPGPRTPPGKGPGPTRQQG